MGAWIMAWLLVSVIFPRRRGRVDWPARWPAVPMKNIKAVIRKMRLPFIIFTYARGNAKIGFSMVLTGLRLFYCKLLLWGAYIVVFSLLFHAPSSIFVRFLKKHK